MSVLFQNRVTLTRWIESGGFDLLLQLIVKEPQANVRAMWLTQMLASPQPLELVATEERLGKVLQFAQQNLDAAARTGLYQRLLMDANIIAVLWNDGGLERLLALAAKEDDDTAILNEAADLIYHLLVLLQGKGLSLAGVIEVLRSRHQPNSAVKKATISDDS